MYSSFKETKKKIIKKKKKLNSNMQTYIVFLWNLTESSLISELLWS